MSLSRLPLAVSPAWRLAAALAAWVGVSYLFRVFDWGAGPVRGALLFELIVALALLGRPTRPAAVDARLGLVVRAALAAGAAIWVGCAAITVLNTARTGVIPLDQGQTSYRAARLLLNGENPYGFGELVDFQTYFDRLAQREAAGIGPALPRAALNPALKTYDLDLGAGDKATLLPAAPHSGPAALEATLLGYKYGPLPVLLALPFAAAHAPAGVMALNAAAAVLMAAAVYLAMRQRVGDPALARLGLAALLFDGAILFNYVERSATDVYALLFCALSVLAAMRGRARWSGAALALGFGCKIFPCALLLPMLVKDGRAGPALVFAAVSAAIYAPFAASDFSGVLHNVFLWPAYLGVDATSWLAFAPPAAAPVARLLGLAGIAWVWTRHLTGREPSLFRTLALATLSALACNGAFHNNYLPWASIWIVAALVERFGPAYGSAEAENPAPRPASTRLAFE